jgi:hyperosmotically inducible periplasmic protein
MSAGPVYRAMYPSEQTFLQSRRIMHTCIIPTQGQTMKLKLSAACFVIGTLLAPFAVHAADTATDTDRTHPKTFVKDSVITTKVKAKLAQEKVSSLAHIKVDTHGKGAVVLSGKVRTQEEADKAVSIARETEGVTSVKSKILVKKDV